MAAVIEWIRVFRYWMLLCWRSFIFFRGVACGPCYPLQVLTLPAALTRSGFRAFHCYHAKNCGSNNVIANKSFDTTACPVVAHCAGATHYDTQKSFIFCIHPHF
jgi:hypothetical protein